MASDAPPGTRFYNRQLETLTREEIGRIQLQGVQDLLERAYHTSPFFRRQLDQSGVKPEGVKTLDDFSKRVPFLTKADLVQDQDEHPPFGSRLLVPEQDIRKLHLTSGTSGKGQEVYALTDTDIARGADTFVYALYTSGLKPGDLSALMWPVATMPGGLIAADSMRVMGLNGMLIQLFDSKTKLKLITRFNVQHFWTTPAYLTRLTVLCGEMGIEPKRDLPRLKAILLSTEAFPPEWVGRMEEFWGCTLHDSYGSSQFGSLYAYTCEGGCAPGGKRGYYHLLEYDTLVEIINPETGEPAKDGEEGEPVVTTFSRQASPLIRFRQGDKVRRLAPGTCGCGRTSAVWEAGTICRLDDMIKMKATNVWPQAVDDVVLAYAEVDEYNGRVFIDGRGRERVEIKLEFRKDTDADARQAVIARLPGQLKDRTDVTMEVIEMPFGTIPRFEYKVRRWADERMAGLQSTKWIEKS